MFCKVAKLSLWSEILQKYLKEFIFSKILALLPIALLKKLLHRYFSRSLIIDSGIPIFKERLSVAASKTHKFLTSFMKLVFVCWNRYLLFYRHQSKKIFFLKTFWNLDNTLPVKCITRVGLLINNPPAIQFFYKFELILCKNRRTSIQIHQNSQLLVVHSVIWSVFPGTVLNQNIHFAVIML